MLKRYLKNTSGNMTITFALSSMFVLAGIGVAVDFNTMYSSRSEFQNYADAAVLAAVDAGEKDLVALNTIAKETVAANNFSGKSVDTSLTVLENGTLHVEIQAQRDLMIMGMFGKQQATVSVVAEAPPTGISQKLNIALVLDVTDSMEGTKIDTLKTAAANLIDEISGGEDGEVMYSVVPFARYVKLPDSTASESWMSLETDSEDCWTRIDEENSVNCQVLGVGEDAYTACDVEVTVEVCEFRTWEGCVASRAAPWNERDYYGGVAIEGFTTDDWCHSTMLPLTTSVSDAKNTIEDMITAQNTYIPAGLIWGWRALMPAAPLTEANTADYNDRKKVMLLMSDGENSASVGGGTTTNGGDFHWNDDAEAADILTSELCESIKADGVEVYVVAFEVTDQTTIDMLRGCATEGKMFHHANSAEELREAFAEIGEGLGGDLRLTK